MSEATLKLYRPAGKGVCLEFYEAGQWGRASKFLTMFEEMIPRKLQWFHQGGSLQGHTSDFHLMEFWAYRGNEELVRSYAIVIADQLGVDLEINLNVKDL